MAIYRGEVTVFKLFPSTADLADPTTAWAGSAYFTAADDLNNFGIGVTWERDATALVGLKLVYRFYFNATGDPNTWTLISGVSSQEDLTPTFTFPQVITLAIQKDTVEDTVSWTTPLGSQTRALSGFNNDDSILRPSCHGAGIGIVGLENTDHGSEAEFRDFFGYVDCVKFLGAALTAADPGVWTATSQYTGPSSGVFIPFTETQNVGTYEWVYTHDAPTVDHTQTRHMRCWNGGDNITGATPAGMDAVVHPMSGTLLVAIVEAEEMDKLSVLRSTNDGASFSTVVVKDEAGLMFEDPSILVTPDNTVYLFHNDGQRGRISYSYSRNDGLTWEHSHYNVVDLFTGEPTVLDKPRFRCDLHGRVWGFWNSTTTAQLVGQGYPVVGGDPLTAVFAESALTEFERPDLYFTSRSDLRVRFRHSATGRVKGSANWGYAWATIVDSRPGEVRQASVTDWERGLTFHLSQETPGLAIRSGVSTDGGETFVSALAGVVVSGVEAQYAALALGHRGQLFALVLNAGVFTCYRSENLGVTWALA